MPSEQPWVWLLLWLGVGLVQIEPGCTLGIQASLNESYFANLPGYLRLGAEFAGKSFKLEFSRFFTDFHACALVGTTFFMNFHEFSRASGGVHVFSRFFTLFHAFSRFFTFFHVFSRFSRFFTVFTFFHGFHVFSRLFTAFHALSRFSRFPNLASDSYVAQVGSEASENQE